MTIIKRLTASVLLLMACSSIPLTAQWLALDFEQVTVAATAIGFTTTKITSPGGIQMTKAVCNLETAEIRYLITGATPTTTVGMVWPVNTSLTFIGHDVLVNFLAIRDSGTSGQIDCTYSAGSQ